MLDKGIIYTKRAKEYNGMRFYYASQNGVQFKNYELFISGVFYVNF